jgi:hypothetical protein
MGTGRSLVRVVKKGAVSMTRKRFAIVAYDDYGRPSVPKPTEDTIQAWPQPVSGDDLERLPEGRRTKEVIKLYSLDEIYSTDTSEADMADIVTIDGKEYEVENVYDWDADGLYWKALAVRKDQ